MGSWTNSDMALAATAVIALLALIRPELGQMLQKVTNSVDLHPAGRIEIGFGNFGPTVGLQGTLRAVNNDQFISSVHVTVVRVVDQLRHSFEWAVFRPPDIELTGQVQRFQIASGFLVQSLTTHRFSIQFHDRTTADRFSEALLAVQQLWLNFLKAKNVILRDTQAADIRKLYDEFYAQKTVAINPHYLTIDREYYWTPGEYALLVRVTTSRPNKEFNYNYRFQLFKPDCDNLRLNVVASIMTVCSVPNLTFNFAYPQYQPALPSRANRPSPTPEGIISRNPP